MDIDRLIALVADLRKLPAETDWAEFKVNNSDPERIGHLISAISNAALLADEPCGYVVWGIANETHDMIGSTFEPLREKKGNQPLEMWLASQIKPSIAFKFSPIEKDGTRIVVLEIPAASVVPTKYKDIAYLRIGNATPKLGDYADREAKLLGKLRPFVWEKGTARAYLTRDEVLRALNYEAYFRLSEQATPRNLVTVMDRLIEEHLIESDVGNRWKILNLGAILFANSLSAFDGIARKSIRVVQYKGRARIDASQEIEGNKGYALGFQGLVDFVNRILPQNEEIVRALRQKRPVYPEIAVRELVANTLIHQDFTITGAGPIIEIFKDRIEITNPGKPLIDTQRFIDMPPRSRNEGLASLMRRMNMCEERGSGIDKVITAVEIFQLPAPDFRLDGDNMKAVLYSPRPFSKMTGDERTRACYQHAVLKFITGEKMTNATLRERLGIEDHNASMVTRVINQALDANLIRASDSWSPRSGHYVPYWA